MHLIKMLEEDASNLLEYMKANGLIANAGKTAFVLLNTKKTIPQTFRFFRNYTLFRERKLGDGQSLNIQSSPP